MNMTRVPGKEPEPDEMVGAPGLEAPNAETKTHDLPVCRSDSGSGAEAASRSP
jgi:hypothetical protein